MIRPIRDSDIQRLKELENGFTWEMDETFVLGLVFTDEQDNPTMFAGGWKKVEVHIAVDGLWGTPGLRWAALRELHEAMRRDLREKGFNEAVTWFEKAEAFGRRLAHLNWVKSTLTSWHRSLR